MCFEPEADTLRVCLSVEDSVMGLLRNQRAETKLNIKERGKRKRDETGVG